MTQQRKQTPEPSYQEKIDRLVAQAPPLSLAQIVTLRRLLNPTDLIPPPTAEDEARDEIRRRVQDDQ
jgi:hypothetical protein